jgi:spoIIIJ-associated protein
MNEKTTLEIIAPTVEEAIAQGLAQLGLTADAVSVEVLDAGNKGLFGFGRHQVRVRLTVNTGPSEQVQKPEPVRVSKPEAQVDSFQEVESPSEADPLLDRTESVISKLLHLLNLEAQVSAHYGERDRDGRRNVHVDIRGNDLSILIGRRSETLNAFQYIASLIVGKEIQDWVQLVIDVEGYRERREKQLIQMAKRMADQVAKSGRRQTLEPMPSAERRIIHIALRDHPDVITESTGDDPHRKVTIVPKNN